MNDYSTQTYTKYTGLLREVLSELPEHCSEFIRAIESRTSILTRYGYATDLRIFFTYLIRTHKDFVGKDISEITLSELNSLETVDFEKFLSYLSLYYMDNDGSELTRINHENAKARKLATLRAFYKHFYKKGKLINSPPTMVDQPKLHNKEIVRLEPNEIVDLLSLLDGEESCLTTQQKRFLAKTRLRDTAILTLFLGTGIRISELVGIDIDDVNFMSNEFSVIRKGGNRDILAFGDEVRSALLDYLVERERILPISGHEHAFFLSLQKRRITVRAVEKMVKKFAEAAIPQKRITPHKLRSTFGTMLYDETGDIYLVADVLGHSDVNTTRKHYAATSRDGRRIAARVIRLRQDDITDDK